MNYLADLLSYSSLFCGFLCVVLSLEGHFVLACWLILLAVIFDGLDGQVARLNQVPSEFGKELDSLIDVVSFGMAPAILAYIFIYRDFYVLSVLSLFVYLLACVIRLARYNITPKHGPANCFSGLPTTAGGGMLAAFVLMSIRRGHANLPQYSPLLFLVMVLILSCLMVSRIRYL
ncbi:MAG: CDP-diacylglycerol--serine O-phosphatidyltransferase, partial [Candidatus Omnitrophica bacterium]|nr:CDP-diacylglycerol--serine O-phosphatidyltransferase [Candidatus Omnitrophota bacterium]